MQDIEIYLPTGSANPPGNKREETAGVDHSHAEAKRTV